MIRPVFVYVKVLKGFAIGKVCRAQVVEEDGQTFYLCCPDSFKIWYTPEYVDIISEERR